MIRRGGMRRPSLMMSSQMLELPAAMPPMSGQWTRLREKPIRRPRAKIGMIRVMSGRCVPPEYGSFRSTPSPSRHASRGQRAKAARIVNGAAPRWTGMSCPWATTCPTLSRRAQDRSAERLSSGEKEVRMITAFISAQAAVRALRTTSKVTGSRLRMGAVPSALMRTPQ